MGERAAARFLSGLGYRVLARNVRVGRGEADLVCRDPDEVTHVVVEVKARVRRPGQPALSADAAPENSVSLEKELALRKLTRALASANRWPRAAVRIDLVAIELRVDEHGIRTSTTVRHHRGAIRL
jgi:putative endonuclease